MAVTAKHRCRVDRAGTVTSCLTLSSSADSIYTRGRGLQRISLMQNGDAKTLRHTYALKAGEFAKKGVVLNFCPFCGVDIRRPISKSHVARSDRA